MSEIQEPPDSNPVSTTQSSQTYVNHEGNGRTVTRKRKYAGTTQIAKDGNERHFVRSKQHRRRRADNDPKVNCISGERGNPTHQIFCSVCKVGDPKYKCPKCRSTYCSIACCRRHKQELCPAAVNKTTLDKIVDAISVGNALVPSDLQGKGPSSKYIPASELYENEKTALGRFKTLSELQKTLTDDDINEDLGLGWKMTDEMANAMKESTWLRNELSDIGLQQLITKIVASSTNMPPIARGFSSFQVRKQRSESSNATYREQMLSEIKSTRPQFQTFVDKLLCLTEIYDRLPLDDNNTVMTPLVDWLNERNVNDGATNNKGKYELVLKPVPRRPRTCKAPLDLANSASETDSAGDSEEDSDEDDHSQ
jgi:zinc finger HIT domain-containing protein 3